MTPNKIAYVIQSKTTDGKIGTFAIDIEAQNNTGPFTPMSPVFNGLIDFYEWAKQRGYQTRAFAPLNELVMEKQPIGEAHHVEEVTVYDPDTQLPVDIAIFKDQQSGGMFGVDASFLMTLSEDDPVNHPFNGNPIRLLEGPFGEAQKEVKHG